MNILKESKEKLPLAFLTTFISDGWDKVGILQDELKAVNETFSNTKEVTEVIQTLIDAYLVCIGQLEQHLTDKKYIELPGLATDLALKEDVNINIENINVTDTKVKIKSNENKEELPNIDIPVNELLTTEQHDKEIYTNEIEPAESTNLEKLQIIEETCKEKAADKQENFEYFVDFPVPAKD